MSKQLRIERAKARRAEKEKPRPVSPIVAAWKVAAENLEFGIGEAERRIPVLLDPNGPVSTPEELQELIGPLTNSTITYTTITRSSIQQQYRPNELGPNEGKEVAICDINGEEEDRLDKVTNTDHFALYVLFEGQVRFATRILSIKPKQN
ncbi:hypothetical protein PT974_07741 [Cladobotryum mycophilum]|uniref:Uncharacterized protein n=1 Tax=Cladobotryum mycophilum TaxID=491253 RepID=A0ABR0SHS2_9HYPO